MASSLIGKSEKMLDMFERIERAAAVDCPVLIHGEPGTGKQLAAETIHRKSRRANRPFVVVPANAIFKRAKTRRFPCALDPMIDVGCGCFEEAQGGTVLIDQITKVPNICQAILLGMLENREANVPPHCKPISDFRLIAKTCMRPFDAIEQGTLREDLYYQLSIVTVKLPPLRERKEDIPLLVRYFLSELCKEQGRPVPSVDDELMQQWIENPWPGNVRQLRDGVASMIRHEVVDVLKPCYWEAENHYTIEH